jgi:hypothetical protein
MTATRMTAGVSATGMSHEDRVAPLDLPGPRRPYDPTRGRGAWGGPVSVVISPL